METDEKIRSEKLVTFLRESFDLEEMTVISREVGSYPISSVSDSLAKVIHPIEVLLGGENRARLLFHEGSQIDISSLKLSNNAHVPKRIDVPGSKGQILFLPYDTTNIRYYGECSEEQPESTVNGAICESIKKVVESNPDLPEVIERTYGASITVDHIFGYSVSEGMLVLLV